MEIAGTDGGVAIADADTAWRNTQIAIVHAGIATTDVEIAIHDAGIAIAGAGIATTGVEIAIHNAGIAIVGAGIVAPRPAPQYVPKGILRNKTDPFVEPDFSQTLPFLTKSDRCLQSSSSINYFSLLLKHHRLSLYQQ